MPFTDSFDRANANLEASATASGGGDWTHDGLVAAGLQINTNQLRCNTSNSTGTAYKSVNQGTADHYAQYKVATTSISSGPFVCCRLADRSNFVGVRNDGSVIEVYRRVGGSLSNLYSSAGGAVAAGDVLRLECSGTNWQLRKNGTVVTSGAIGNGTLTSTDTGVVARTTVATFADDLEFGSLASAISVNATGSQVAMSTSSPSVGGIDKGAATFTDNFNRADNWIENTPTTSGGQTWATDGLGVNTGGISGNQWAAANTTSGGSLTYFDIGNVNHWVSWTSRDASANSFVVLRGESRDKYIGLRTAGANLQIYRVTGGTFTSIYNTNHGIASGDTIEARIAGDQIEVRLNAVLIVSMALSASGWIGTRVGIHNRQAVQNPFLDNFEAGLTSGAASGATLTTNLLTMSLNNVSVSAGTETTFADTFNRADGWLEEAPCKTASGGWNWVWDSAIVHGLSVFNNILYAGVTDSVGSAYKTPSVGSADHYVECIVPAGLAGSISHVGAQSFVCCRLADRNNFVGFHVGNEGAGAGQVVVARRVAGTFVTLYTSGAAAVATGDLLRLECEGSNWTLKNDGAVMSSGAIGAALNDVGTGIVGRGFIGEVAENFEAGPLTTFADPLFYDHFDRADGPLESTPIASSGGTWVHDGRFAGLAVSGNQLRSTSVDESGSAYKCNPSPGVLDHFIEFTAIGDELIYGPGACCRMPDHNQFVGLFHGATTAINFGHVEVWRETAGLGTIAQIYNSGDGGYVDGDVLRLAAVGSNWYVFKNGTLMASGAIGATLTSTDTGIIGGGSIGNFFDDFVTGPQTLGLLTTNLMTIASGTVTVSTPSAGEVFVTGNQMTMSRGDVIADVSVDVDADVITGNFLVASVGDVQAVENRRVFITGFQLTMSLGITHAVTQGFMEVYPSGNYMVAMTVSPGSMSFITFNNIRFGYLPWRPSLIGGLRVHLDATMLDLEEGEEVTEWPLTDEAIGLDPVMVGTPLPVYRSTAMNGRPVVRFTALQSRLRGDAEFTDAIWSMAYVVRKWNPVTGFPHDGYCFAAMAPKNLYVGFSPDGQDAFADTVSALTGSTSNQDWKIYGGNADGTITEFRKNGTVAASSGLPGGMGGEYGLGGRDPDSQADTGDFDVAELVLYNADLTESVYPKIDGYLAWKWGLQGLLSPTHPYKNDPPQGASTIDALQTEYGTVTILIRYHVQVTLTGVQMQALTAPEDSIEVEWVARVFPTGQPMFMRAGGVFASRPGVVDGREDQREGLMLVMSRWMNN
jgi:hypothetical protein